MLKIKVLNGNGWYKNEIDNIFDVSDIPVEVNNHMSFKVLQNNTPTALCIRMEDCEELIVTNK